MRQNNCQGISRGAYTNDTDMEVKILYFISGDLRITSKINVHNLRKYFGK